MVQSCTKVCVFVVNGQWGQVVRLKVRCCLMNQRQVSQLPLLVKSDISTSSCADFCLFSSFFSFYLPHLSNPSFIWLFSF